MNKHYDYLVVGQVFTELFLRMRPKRQESLFLLLINARTLPEMYIQKTWKKSMYINMEHTFSIQTTKRSGIISHSLQNLTVLPTARLPIITESFIRFRLICTHSTRCGVW